METHLTFASLPRGINKESQYSMHTSATLGLLQPSSCAPISAGALPQQAVLPCLQESFQSPPSSNVGYFIALRSDCTCSGSSWEMLYWSTEKNFWLKIKIPCIWRGKNEPVSDTQQRCRESSRALSQARLCWGDVQSWPQPNEPPGNLGCAMGAQLGLIGVQNKAEKLVMP